NDLENGGTFCGDCYLDINNTIDIEADVCWVSGTLTLDGDGGDGDFSMDDGVTFTVVSGTVIVEDGDANISPGADLVILDDAIFSVADDLIVEEGAGVVVDGLLDVTDNIDIGETLTGGIVVNEGGSANAQRVDGQQPDNEDDLPDNIDLSNGGGFNVNGVELPVELLSFTGGLFEGKQIVQLSWSTGSEIDNRGFFVERSIDGQDFEKIAFVEGHGTTTDIHEYAFIDQTIEVSSYYQLRQVDFDGVNALSYLIYVSLIDATSNDPISIYPNPTYGEVTFDGLRQEVYDIQMMNLSGKVVLNLASTSLENSEVEINRYLTGATKGVYLLRFANPGYSEIIRLISK
ncbi:MAG: T9SS type A sorting domain-containing protein, partial [Cyclobacteriaceae bacterium]